MISTTAPTVRRCASILALLAGVGFAAAAVAQTPDTSKPLTGEAASVKKLLEKKFDGVSVTRVTKSPYFGLYEVMFDDQLVYTDAKATYVIVGNVYDTASKKNLTEARMRDLTRVPFDSLPLELAVKKVKGTGQRKLAIFSDPDCPYCARLEKELAGIDDVTIYTFLYPIDGLHPDAARKARLIWCSPDPRRAWEAFFESGALPKNNGDCDNPIEATGELGRKMRVAATPTLVFADGSVVAGALPAPRLESELRRGEAEASRPASNKK